MIQVDLSLLRLDPELRIQLENACHEVCRITGPNQKSAYIEAHDKLWRATLGALAQLTNNTEDDCKCWYCECDGSAGFSFHVDHFRPKKRVKNTGYKKDQYEPGYWWLAFNPLNYRVSCQRCNSGAGKNDQFPLANGSPRAISEGGESLEKILLVDPNSPRDPDLLVFSQDGDVHPGFDCVGDEKKRAETSIKVYNLRARSKREGRRKIWNECYESIIKARQARDNLRESLLMPEFEKNAKITEFRDAYEKIKRMTLRNAKFSATVKSCIREYYKVERARAQQEYFIFDLDWLLSLL